MMSKKNQIATRKKGAEYYLLPSVVDLERDAIYDMPVSKLTSRTSCAHPDISCVWSTGVPISDMALRVFIHMYVEGLRLSQPRRLEAAKNFADPRLPGSDSFSSSAIPNPLKLAGTVISLIFEGSAACTPEMCEEKSDIPVFCALPP